MGTLGPDTGNTESDVYLSLGLKVLNKRVLGSPRVLKLLSSLLERSVEENESLGETAQIKDVVTVFHGLTAPTISVQHYIDRIFKYSGCSPSCFVVAHIYLDRFLQRTDGHLTSLNIHRLLITSVMIAAKFVDDGLYNNAYYARVGGVTTAEINSWKMKLPECLKLNERCKLAESKKVGQTTMIQPLVLLPHLPDEGAE